MNQLSDAEQKFLRYIAENAPDILSKAKIGKNPNDGSLQIVLSSPSGDPERALTLWLDDGVPSIGFGRWHTHGDPITLTDEDSSYEISYCDLVLAIVNDQFVLARHDDSPYDELKPVGADVRQALIQEAFALQIRILSFTGSNDCVIIKP